MFTKVSLFFRGKKSNLSLLWPKPLLRFTSLRNQRKETLKANFQTNYMNLLCPLFSSLVFLPPFQPHSLTSKKVFGLRMFQRQLGLTGSRCLTNGQNG